MTDTPNLGLPLIEAAQAQKHVTHNEALGVLDTLVQLSVLSRALSAPPSTPAEGDRYIVKATGTGAFAGKDNQIALFSGGGWQFFPPHTGWLAFVADEAVLIAWNASAWVSAATSGLTALQNLALLGVGTTADATNPLSAKLNNALWIAKTTAEGGDGTLRYKLSKESAAKTLSFLFQDNFSGRAELGLTGDDDFHFKVSADGSTWIDAIVIDKTSGSAKLNAGFFLTGDITPSQITADQNDYGPTGLSTSSILRLSSDASRNITGLAGGGDGRIIAIVNAGTSNIVLKDASTASSASNRFAFGADVTLGSKQSAMLWYDATDSRWKLLAVQRIGAVSAVVDGGTGATSLTDYAVLCGGTTSTGAVQPIASVGTAGQALTSNGAGALPTFKNSQPDIQVFTSSGTWTKQTGAVFVQVEAWGGGGGAGGGARTVSGTASSGGGGGGGSYGASALLPASSLGSTETVTIGAGGSGGNGATSNGTAGSDGAAGGTSSFGSWVSGFGGGLGAGGQVSGHSGGGGGAASLVGGGAASGATAGAGGGAGSGNGGSNAAGGNGTFGGAGGAGGGNGTSGSNGGHSCIGSAGGGGGGGISTTPAAFSGGNGGRRVGYYTAIAGGTATNPGSSGTAFVGGGGCGGSGGGSNTSGTGGAGGAGVQGGGGGGGASAIGGNGGAGGAGGNGWIRVTTYF